MSMDVLEEEVRDMSYFGRYSESGILGALCFWPENLYYETL